MVAFFTSTDPTGCIITDAVVAAGAGSVHLVPGGPEQTVGVEVTLVQFNACTQIYLMTAVGGTTRLTFQFERDLSVASVSASLSVADVSPMNIAITGRHERQTNRPSLTKPQSPFIHFSTAA